MQEQARWSDSGLIWRFPQPAAGLQPATHEPGPSPSPGRQEGVLLSQTV